MEPDKVGKKKVQSDQEIINLNRQRVRDVVSRKRKLGDQANACLHNRVVDFLGSSLEAEGAQMGIDLQTELGHLRFCDPVSVLVTTARKPIRILAQSIEELNILFHLPFSPHWFADGVPAPKLTITNSRFRATLVSGHLQTTRWEPHLHGLMTMELLWESPQTNSVSSRSRNSQVAQAITCSSVTALAKTTLPPAVPVAATFPEARRKADLELELELEEPDSAAPVDATANQY